MLKIDDINTEKKNRYIFHVILFLIVLLAGMQNSEGYLNFMGLNLLVTVIKLIFYVLLFSTCYFLIIKNLLLKTRYNLNSIGSLQFWIVLIIAVFLKFFILLIQNPSSVLPEGDYFVSFFDLGVNITLMIFLANVINNIDTGRIIIWALGLGAALSAIIPIIFFPEMIGFRSSEVQGFTFVGAFWNSSVISFISIAWIAIALANIEKSKLKKGILISIFVILLFGGVAGLSRAILVSIVFSVIVYLLLAKNLKKYIKVFIAVLISFLLIINLFPDLFSNFSERLEGGIDVENEGRTAIWFDYLEDLPSFILFGAIDGDYRQYSSTGHGPHSVFLNWLVQYGILGLMGFALLMFGLLKSVNKIKRRYLTGVSAALYAWIVAYLSVGTVNETGFNQLTVFAAFGIILGWGKVSSMDKETIINDSYKNV